MIFKIDVFMRNFLAIILGIVSLMLSCVYYSKLPYPNLLENYETYENRIFRVKTNNGDKYEFSKFEMRNDTLFIFETSDIYNYYELKKNVTIPNSEIKYIEEVDTENNNNTIIFSTLVVLIGALWLYLKAFDLSGLK